MVKHARDKEKEMLLLAWVKRLVRLGAEGIR